MSYRKKAHKHALEDMEECLMDIDFDSYKPLLFSHETNLLNYELGIPKAPIIKERKRECIEQKFFNLENKVKYEWSLEWKEYERCSRIDRQLKIESDKIYAIRKNWSILNENVKSYSVKTLISYDKLYKERFDFNAYKWKQKINNTICYFIDNFMYFKYDMNKIFIINKKYINIKQLPLMINKSV